MRNLSFATICVVGCVTLVGCGDGSGPAKPQAEVKPLYENKVEAKKGGVTQTDTVGMPTSYGKNMIQPKGAGS